MQVWGKSCHFLQEIARNARFLGQNKSVLSVFGVVWDWGPACLVENETNKKLSIKKQSYRVKFKMFDRINKIEKEIKGF